jgi:hypothetical protein
MKFFLLHFFYKQSVFITLCFCIVSNTNTFANTYDTTQTSTREQAIAFIEKINELKPSAHWPKIKPALFLKNVKENIYTPLTMYAGTNTNFCGYATLSYLFLQDDPLGYAKLMLQLYKDGKAKFAKVFFQPSQPIMDVAGSLKFRGELDIRPAEQMWFLCLADHFKGYLNYFNTHYDAGDENNLWAAVNYAKFNRMIKRLLNYNVASTGSDLIRPMINDMYEYLFNLMKNGITVVYLNNTVLHKKHDLPKVRLPSHYVILLDLNKVNDNLINFTYWDYGFRTLRQISPSFLQKIIFGISHCTKKIAHEK